MFWQTPLLFLGILVTVGNTVPFSPTVEHTTYRNNDVAHLLKRYDDPSTDYIVFRADRYVNPCI
jgi:hypothetical protein